MNNSEANSSKWSPLQKTSAALAAAGTVGYGLYNPEGLWETAWWIANSVNSLLQGGGELVNEWLQSAVEVVWQNISFIWAAAPFAAPMIAGWYLGKKVADITGVENKYVKIAASAVGAGAWILLGTSVVAPYITGVAAATALYKPFKWSLQKAGKLASSVYGGVTGAVGGAVKGAAMGAYYWTKTNWNEQNVIPDVWFQRKVQQS